jgi:hypothetical protein
MGFIFINSTIDFIVDTSLSPIWKSLMFPYWSGHPPYHFAWKSKSLSPKKGSSKPQFTSMNIKIVDTTAAEESSLKVMSVQLLPG